MHRSSSVSGKCPIVAITFGHQHENLTSLDSFPALPSFLLSTLNEDLSTCLCAATRTTKAVFLVYPAFKIPLSTSFPCRNVSASSINKVGCFSSIARYTAGELILASGTARLANSLSTLKNVVFPHRFSGDSTPRYALTSRKGKAYVCSTHKAAVSAAHGGSTTCLRMTAFSSFSNSPPSTASGHGSTSSISHPLWPCASPYPFMIVLIVFGPSLAWGVCQKPAYPLKKSGFFSNAPLNLYLSDKTYGSYNL